MKKFVLLLTIAMGVVVGSVSAMHHTEADAEATYVYICTGPKSTVYHKTDKCRGLKNCSTSVKKVTVQEAEKMGRRACKICIK